MSDLLTPFAQLAHPNSPCKCCGATAPLYGVTDFNKSCNVHDPLPLSGVPVYYYRCPNCGFIFTTAFDGFTREDFCRWIYNDDYARVDPDYLEKRPRTNAGQLTRLFGNSKHIRILDYGGGDGLLGRLLRDQGFEHVDTYDPHVSAHATRPRERYDLVTAFEVVEHSPRPREVFADIISLKKDDGMALISTPIQPADINELGMNWWFIAPRNAHVSIHTASSIRTIAKEHGLRIVSEPSKVWHLLLGDVPPAFAAHMRIPPAESH